MSRVSNCAPPEIRVWRVAGAIHANIPRTVVRQPRVIDHRPKVPEPPVGARETADLALNILNLMMPPQQGARAELEPVKCFRGHCSSFAARHHGDFARDFVQPLLLEGGAISTAKIVEWIERRLATYAVGARSATEYAA